MKTNFNIKELTTNNLHIENSDAFYHIYLFNGSGKLIIDFAEYTFCGQTIVFTSPYQNIKIESNETFNISRLDFHGDFYCIEYHKKEIACNGLLFNNIYLHPNIPLSDEIYTEIEHIFRKIKQTQPNNSFSDAVLKSYLQLILAICSQEKMKILQDENIPSDEFQHFKTFQELVEQHFIKERSVAFYAEKLNISANALSKKIKAEFGKTPIQLIQERVILEAKKQIHLTKKSIKEIATDLNFEDEYYFSKYFKKNVGISPTGFREEVGISIVAG